MMKNVGIRIVLLGCGIGAALLMSSAVAADSALTLVQGGASTYSIVLEPSASPSEKTAAEELQSYLKACTGVELPIRSAVPDDKTPMIVLGCGPIAAQLGVEPTAEQLGSQGCQLRTVPPHLVLAGTPQGGTLYGVREFLQKYLGVRWYAPGVTKTPAQKEVTLPTLNTLVRPAFLWREMSYTWPGGDEAFFRHRGIDVGKAQGDDGPQGKIYQADGKCHSYYACISPDEYFAEHPEYFSEIGGKRIREETQLCLTNPDVLNIVTEKMLKRMREAPNVQQHNFSQMDCYNYCECEKCRAINEKYQTAGGTQFWFVNELAKRTAKEFPNKLIGTLAYMYTEEPPQGMTMHPNVAVWLCHMYPCCDSHPVATCPYNAHYKRRAETWAKICSHLYIWHYVVNFAHYYNPFPNLRADAANLRFYQQIGAEGVYAQAMSSGGGGEMALLRGYYITELLKNPQQDPQAVLRDFLEGYYGAAAEPIYQYLALLHDKVKNENLHMHLYTNPAQGYLTDEVMSESARLFDEAEAAVKDDEELLERVRVARMPLTYAMLFPRNGYTIEEGTLRFTGPMATFKEVEEFQARMKRHSFNSIREIGGDAAQIPMLMTLFHTPEKLIVLENAQVRVEVAPLLGGRALRIIDRATGRCATAFNTKQNLIFPFCGGEESRVGEFFAIHEGGSMVQFLPLTQTARSVTMVGKTGNGFQMTRTLTLAEDAPVLTVQVKVTNPSDKPQAAQVRSHLSLELGDLRSTRVRFTGRDGQAVDKDMNRIVDAWREGERFYKGQTPAESWTFRGSAGLELTERFPREQVESSWIYAYPEENRELEVELWAPKKVLAPGESVSLEHSLEVKAVK